MGNKVRFIVLICLLSVGLVSFRSFAKVAGSVQDLNGEKLAGASVMLLSLPDSTLVKAVLADTDGRFNFSNESETDRIVIAEFPGYNRGIVNASSDCRIILEPKTTDLAEVEVVAKGNDVRAEDGKYKYIPGAVARKMPTAFDALSISPMIKKDDSGNLSLFYREIPATIYINGRKPKEGQESVLARLRSIPPENIIRIEVWPNPGLAEKNSEGGIINVEIRNPDDGTSGSLSFYSSLYHGRVTNALSSYTFIQKGKLHSSVLAQYNGNNSKSEKETLYTFNTSGKNISDRVENSSFQNLASVSYYFSYDLTRKSSIGGGFGGQVAESHSHSRIRNIDFFEDGDYEVSNSVINENSPLDFSNLGGYLFYNLQLDNRRSFFEVLASGLLQPEHKANKFLNLYDFRC